MTAEKTPFPREGSFFMERNRKPGETVGRDRDRDRGGAFQYSRRGLRLRRRGVYGIHRASGPRCQGLCRKVASLRSGGRRLAVRIAIEHPIGALPRTPFPASRDFPSRGNEKIGGTGYCVTYDTDSQSRNAPCVPFRGRGPRSGEGMYEGKNDYDTRCGRDRRRRHYKTHCPLKGKRLTTFCASLRSGAADWRSGQRWSTTSMLYLVHPFASSRHFPSRGNERYEGKNSESYTSGTISAFSPFGGWRHHLSPSSRGHYGCLAMEPCLCRKA